MTFVRSNSWQNVIKDEKNTNETPLDVTCAKSNEKSNSLTFRAAFIFKKIPYNEAWRIFVDGNLQNNLWALSGRFLTSTTPFCKELLNLKCSTFFELYSQYPLEKVPQTELEQDINKLKKFPEISLWKAGVNLDLTFEENFVARKGWTGFEGREPGYMSAVCEAFSYILENINLLSPIHLQILHFKATKDVKNLSLNHGVKKVGTEFDEFRFDPDSYSFIGFKDDKCPFENLKTGLITVLNKIASGEHNYLFLETQDKDGTVIEQITHANIGPKESFDSLATRLLIGKEKLFYCSIPLREKSITAFIEQMIERYEQAINLSENNLDKKLEIIIQLICDLHHLHPFYDGNTRAFGMILLNQLLLKNGLLPAFLSNPNDFERYPMTVLKEKVMDGMKNTLRLCLGLTIFDVTTSEIYNSCNATEKDYFQKSLSVLKNYFKTSIGNTSAESVKHDSKVICKASIEEIIDVMFKLYNNNKLAEPLLDHFIKLETRQKAFEIGVAILADDRKEINSRFAYFQPSGNPASVVTHNENHNKPAKCCTLM